MQLLPSSEFIRLETWISALANSYAHSPCPSLATHLLYYLNRLIEHDDFSLQTDKQCHYLLMRKYWLWASNPAVIDGVDKTKFSV